MMVLVWAVDFMMVMVVVAAVVLVGVIKLQ